MDAKLGAKNSPTGFSVDGGLLYILIGNPNLLPGVDQAGVRNIVVVGQCSHRGAVGLGDAPECVPGL